MNKYNPNIHHRKSIRLKNYDYAQEGLYFITICVQHHQCVFGNLTNGKMKLNEIGNIVQQEWLKTADLRPNVRLHNFVVMPNHFHGILEIVDNLMDVGWRGVARNAPPVENVDDSLWGVARNAPTGYHQNSRNIDNEMNEYMASISPKSGELGTIVRAFKSSITKNIHLAGYGFEWQRNYYEHIIRDYGDYSRIDDYITNNPIGWEKDRFYKKY